jgi:hypothetical protein
MAVVASAQSLGGISQQWMIGNMHRPGSNNMMTYPSSVDCIEGDLIEFPVAGLKKKLRKNLSLIKLWSPSQSTQNST